MYQQQASLFKHLQGKVRTDIRLKDYVTYRIGGPADIFIEPASDNDIEQTVVLCQKHSIPLVVIGSGSNLLIGDNGIRGVVLYLGAGLTGDVHVLSQTDETVLIDVPAHWPKAKLLEYAVDHSWSGLEFSSGIPGTLGGAIYMNAGTKWGSYADVVESVRFYNPQKGFYLKSKQELGFKYRGHGEGLLDATTIVVSIRMTLKKTKQKNDILTLVDQILSERGLKQPLEFPNCGSVFKNPEGNKGAGRLIEACGLKGTKAGGAQISLKHANFILNVNEAKAADVESLIELIQKTVAQKFGIHLEPEVIRLGQ